MIDIYPETLYIRVEILFYGVNRLKSMFLRSFTTMEISVSDLEEFLESSKNRSKGSSHLVKFLLKTAESGS